MNYKQKKTPVKEVYEVARRLTRSGIVIVFNNGSQRLIAIRPENGGER